MAPDYSLFQLPRKCVYMYIPWVSAGTHQVMGSWFPLSMDVSKDRELLRRRNISKNFF